ATASWKAFLEYNGEFIDKKEPEEYDFSKRPRIDNSVVEAAFKQFESDFCSVWDVMMLTGCMEPYVGDEKTRK
ncbi:unnamed protein product, partial [Tilletia laevis]